MSGQAPSGRKRLHGLIAIFGQQQWWGRKIALSCVGWCGGGASIPFDSKVDLKPLEKEEPNDHIAGIA